ncbi:TPA: hypothetical protein EYP27_02375, partial [Candidatus Bathyarchaeota archaeon]|nr:hypothetical protein [Candidatus Bathyarchaeota archaeon]
MRYSLTLVLLLLLVPLARGEEEPFVNETFEKFAEGEEPEGWDVVETGNVEVKVADFEGSKRLYVRMVPNQVAGMSKQITPVEEGIFTVEYDLYFKSIKGAGFELLYIMSTATASGDPNTGNFNGVCVAMNIPGVLSYNNGGNWMNGPNLKEGRWYHFKYVISMDKNEWELYLDEKSVDKGIKFRGDIQGKLDLVYVANVWGAGSPDCELYFDNIRVYPGTEWKWVPVETKDSLPSLWGEIKTSFHL